MHEEDSGAPDVPESPSGHRDPPGVYFYACGLRLPMGCPHCSAINRGQANFCIHCGMGLGDVRRTHAAPSVVLLHSSTSTESSPAPESQSPAAPWGPFELDKQTADGPIDVPDSDDRVTQAPESGKEWLADEDALRLSQIVRFVQQQRRRSWVRLGAIGASFSLGLLGAALVRTHSATSTAEPSAVIGAGVQERIAIPAGRSGSAAIPQRTLASALDLTAHGRTGDLTFVVPSEPPSHDAGGAETFALFHPAPQSNTLLRNARMPTAGDRHAGSVLSVAPDRLVVHEVGRAGEGQKLRVTITGKTRIIESRRNPAAFGAQDAFADQSISLAEVKKGDYVVVDASRQGTKLVASSITVTLRREAQLARPDPNDPAPPTSAAAVAPRVEPQKQSGAPTARATTPAQPSAPPDTEDPNSVIEWLLYPAAGRLR